MRIIPLIAGAALAVGLAAPARAEVDWTKVDQAIGRPGAAQPDGVHRYGLPRTDLHVTLDAVELKPTLALGGWLAFQPMGDEAMVMGDLVLTQDEVGPVMKSLAEGGLAVPALHNQMPDGQPRLFFIHFWANDDAGKLARGLRAALDEMNLAKG